MKRRMAQRAPVRPKKMDGKMFCQMHTISISTYKINVTMGQLCSHGLDIHLLQNVILLLLLGNRKHRLTHQANTPGNTSQVSDSVPQVEWRRHKASSQASQETQKLEVKAKQATRLLVSLHYMYLFQNWIYLNSSHS